MRKLYLSSEGAVTIPAIIADIGKKNLKVILISTASETKQGPKVWLDNEMAALKSSGCEVMEYTLTGKNSQQVKEDLAPFDVIYISGGNTFYLLEKVQQSQSAEIIKNYIDSGKIYIGSSAGGILAGPDIYPSYILDKANEAPNIMGYVGLGLTDVVVFPHWGSERFKDRYLNHRLEHAFPLENKYILLRDTQYLKVEDDKYQIIDTKTA